MGTAINVTVPDGHEQSPVVPDAAGEPRLTVGGPGPDASGKSSLVVEVTIVPDGDPPAPVRHADARDIEAARSAREEDDALDAEDILTQAEEAGAVDPVG